MNVILFKRPSKPDMGNCYQMNLELSAFIDLQRTLNLGKATQPSVGRGNPVKAGLDWNWFCNTFLKLSVQQRWQLARKHKICLVQTDHGEKALNAHTGTGLVVRVVPAPRCIINYCLLLNPPNMPILRETFKAREGKVVLDNDKKGKSTVVPQLVTNPHQH